MRALLSTCLYELLSMCVAFSFFLTLFLLIGCAPNKAIVTKISCPSVFFSTEHNTYIRGNTEPITVENLRYIANINNFKFISDCSIIDNKFEAKLSILFIVKPEQTTTADILLPFYVAVIDSNEKLVEIQYYQTKGKFIKSEATEKYMENDLVKTIKLQILPADDEFYLKNSIIIGFMLDEKKLEIIN